MTPGKIIKTARNIRGYSQVKISERYGIAESTLRNYEKGRTPVPYDVVKGILKYLHLEEEEVISVA